MNHHRRAGDHRYPEDEQREFHKTLESLFIDLADMCVKLAAQYKAEGDNAERLLVIIPERKPRLCASIYVYTEAEKLFRANEHFFRTASKSRPSHLAGCQKGCQGEKKEVME